jgi:ECF sigma factor
MVTEVYRNRLDAPKDENLRRVESRKAEGNTKEEIAACRGCAPRRVADRVKLIRLKWEQR